MFFVFSKVLWFLLSPFNMALFALTGAMLAMYVRRHLVARTLGIAAWAILMVFGVLPTGQILTHVLESQYAAPEAMPRRVHGIIVLGGVLDTDMGYKRGVPQMAGTADRLAGFADLARQYPYARLVFTSGQGSLKQRGTPEAQMAREALAMFGLHPTRGRLLIEENSRTTWENATLSKELVQPVPGQTWLMVTSAWHMPRAMGAFRKAGWDVVPYPTDYLTPTRQGFLGNMQLSHVAVKELLGLAAYRLAGKWQGAAKPVEPLAAD